MNTILSLAVLVMLLDSCCFGNRKCKSDYNSVRIRILNSGGQDLVFGPSRIYDKNSIRFYSLNGTDTVHHRCEPGPNAIPGYDSLLYVDFDYSKQENVYVLLSSSDIDTLKLAYPVVDASPCCPDYSNVNTVSYNNNVLQTPNSGITIIYK